MFDEEVGEAIVRGRWLSLKTAKIYIRASQVVLRGLSITTDQRRTIATYKDSLSSFLSPSGSAMEGRVEEAAS